MALGCYELQNYPFSSKRMLEQTTKPVIPEDYFSILEKVGDRFSHCLTVSALHLPDQPVVYANYQFEAATGYSRQETVGRNCRFLQGPETDPRATRLLGEAIRENRSVFVDLVNYTKSGTPFLNRLVLLPFNYFFAPDERYYIGVQRRMDDRHDPAATPTPRDGEIEHRINNPLCLAMGFAEIEDVDVDLIDGAIDRIEAYVDQL